MDEDKNPDLQEDRLTIKEEYFKAVEKYLDTISKSQIEIDRVLSVYKWLAGCITILIIFGIGLGTYLTATSFSGLKADMRENIRGQFDYMKEKTSQDFSSLSNKLTSDFERNISDVESKVKNRVDEEFNKDNIRTLVQEKAQEYTAKNVHKYMEERVEGAIQPISSSLKEIEREAKKIDEDSKEAQISINRQLEDLNKRNRLMKLADIAIDKNDADSFRELLKYGTTDTTSAASGELARVKLAYLAGIYRPNEPLTVTEADGSKNIGQNIKTSTLIKTLKTDKFWEARAKAAELLGSRSEKGVPEVLLEACQVDKQLAVVRAVIQGFTTITGHAYDVLECNSLEAWWAENKSAIDKRLKPIDSK
jgi:hypothetical protein